MAGTHENSGGVGPLKLLDGATSSGTSGPLIDMREPQANLGLQVSFGSTDGQVLLKGGLSSGLLTTLVTWEGSSDGSTLLTGTGPVSWVQATLEAGGSSGGCDAYMGATP